MEINTDILVENAIRDGLREAMKQRFSQGYNNPLDKIIEAAIAQQAEAMRSLFAESLASCLGDAKFREDIASAVRSTLARTLVQRFGGEMEKQVNALKSDPVTRARITVAIEEIVKQKVA